MDVQLIYGLKVDIPEPKSTVSLDTNQLFELIELKYKQGSKGKEYNLITAYTNSIYEAVFKKAKTKDNIEIKYPFIRKEWVAAALKYKTNKKIDITNVGVVYKGNILNQ